MQRKPRTKLQAKMESVVHIKQPMVRDYSTAGGHHPGDVLLEDGVNTKKWQGYPPENLNVLGKPMLPLPEVAMPRFLGTAQYASRVVLPNMLYAKFLASPHPHAKVKKLDVSKAQKMPGVAYILTRENAPKTSYRGAMAVSNEELEFQGQVVAIVAADTEDLAEDAVEAIEVEYQT